MADPPPVSSETRLEKPGVGDCASALRLGGVSTRTRGRSCVALVLILATVMITMTGSDLLAQAAPKRAVAVLYDDSGSMNSQPSKWIGANFSMQVTPALLMDGDEFYLIRMNAQPEPRRYDVPAGVDVLIREMQQQRVPAGMTPYDGVQKLLEQLGASAAEEKWLVVITDGDFQPAFDPALVQEQVNRFVRPMGIRTIFLQIEAPETFAAARLWRETAGAVLMDASSGPEIPEKMEQIGALLTGRDADGVALKRSGAELLVSSKFPLRGLVVLVQGKNTLTVRAAETGTRPMTVRSHSIRSPRAVADVPRNATVAHLVAKDGIAAGEDVARIQFSGEISTERVKVYAEVAARMEVTLIGGDGQPLARDAEGFFNLCSGEAAVLRTRLLGLDQRPVTIGRTDLAVFDVGYESLLGGSQESLISSDQSSFEATITPQSEVRILPFARYPSYFNYQGEVLNLRPIACDREVVVALETPLDADGYWTARVDQLDAAPPLRFGVTIDGQPATEDELRSWSWYQDTDQRWQLKVEGTKILLYPVGGCCAGVWSRPTAHVGQIEVSQWGAPTSKDRMTFPEPVRFAWVLPENAFARLWWLVGCPLTAALAVLATLWYLRRVIFLKDRFGRRATIYIRKDGRANTLRRLVRNRDLLPRWFWPSMRESRVVEGYWFIAVGRGGHVLVPGKALGERDEVTDWQFDPDRAARRENQRDAKLPDDGTIRRRRTERWNDYDIELQYSLLGLRPEGQWPE